MKRRDAIILAVILISALAGWWIGRVTANPTVVTYTVSPVAPQLTEDEARAAISAAMEASQHGNTVSAQQFMFNALVNLGLLRINK